MELSKNKSRTKKLVISGILIAISTILGTFSIPLLGAKVAPIQHLVNVIAAVILGPVYGVGCAFVSSLLRNILGTGSLLAFPGSMVGVFLSGLLYKKFKKTPTILPGKANKFVLGREVAMFVYIVPFSLSSFIGSFLAYIILKLTTLKQFLINN